MGLDTVELVMEFEDEFDLKIPDEDAEKIQTVGNAVDFIVGVLRSRHVALRSNFCESAHHFRQMRRAMQVEFDLPREEIRPCAQIGDLIPSAARVRWSEFARRNALPKTPFSFFAANRFPDPQTTLRELVQATQRGTYYTNSGEVHLERVVQKVREIVSEQAGVGISEIQRNVHFINDLHLD